MSASPIGAGRMSGRKVGTVTRSGVSLPPVGAVVTIPSGANRSVMALAVRPVPSRALILAGRTSSSTGPGTSPTTSIVPAATRIDAPAVSANRSMNRDAARSIPAGSQPRSKRAEASVRSTSRVEVLAMAMGSK